MRLSNLTQVPGSLGSPFQKDERTQLFLLINNAQKRIEMKNNKDQNHDNRQMVIIREMMMRQTTVVIGMVTLFKAVIYKLQVREEHHANSF